MLKLWQRSLCFFVGLVSVFGVPPALAEVVNQVSTASNESPITTIRCVRDLQRPAMTVKEWLSQGESGNNQPVEIVQVTGVKANPTDKGVEVILETPQGTQLQVTNRSTGNNFIADVSGGQLRLPSGEAFTFGSEKPVEGITEITVTNIDANTVRVTVVGEKALPTVELFDDNAGLVFGVTTTATATQSLQRLQTPQAEEKPANQTPQQQPSTQQDEPIELVVTGEQDVYRVPNASIATRTDTPLRDIPQSIQVVPQQVLKDQQVNTVNEALRNVTGVSPTQQSDRNYFSFTARGFESGAIIRNGLPSGASDSSIEFSNVERIEFLSGPASVLFGQGGPGGTLNVITKQPLRDPFYAIEATVGSYDYYRGAVDLSGPLNDSKTVSYRLNASYLDKQGFTDFFYDRVFLIAPVIRWEISPKTNFTLEADYTNAKNLPLYGLPAVGTVLPNPNGEIPRNRNINEPDAYQETKTARVGYRLEHQFSDNWLLRNAFQVAFVRDDAQGASASELEPDNRILDRGYGISKNDVNYYNLTTDIIGKFSTGSIKHQLLFGVDLSRSDTIDSSGVSGSAPSLDLFNPVYGQPLDPLDQEFSSTSVTDALGVYVQDQVTLTDNLKLLLGGRFDITTSTSRDELANTESSQADDAFTPRVGIVYQPIKPISLYASYSRSFTPNSGTDFESNLFQPERGTQYEVGIKADISDKLSATLAFYDLTKSNILTKDTRPDIPPGEFSIQIGEQRSRGIELNLAGEILPGWNIFAGYAYTDARITEDNTLPVGNQLYNTPENAFNLWTSYEIQKGSMQGLGFGVGFFFVGDRQGDLENTFKVPSYVTTDAAIFYKRGQLRTQINFKNLFNVDYFEATRDNLRVFPGQPFTVQGTISWEF
ncbi:MAG: TonB-dependent siderophore receptor [Nostoc sp.]|uniref:TonB-dependent siderophore receptor n=1 Tax=Nostoc sp. TaxID=1180 RepID=UPI002FF709DF